MTVPLFVLIPPSQAKRSGGGVMEQAGSLDEVLAKERRRVRAALKRELGSLTDKRATSLFKARGELLDEAIRTSRAYTSRRPGLLPAWQRYRGVVWSTLAAETLSPRRRSRIFVPSGLYGITCAEDPIVDYRLSMDVSLAGLGNLATFWREPVTRALKRPFEGGTVVDLLPREHRAVVDHQALAESCTVVRVDFVQHDGTGAAGHAAKAAKGVLARSLLTGTITSVEEFRWEGWNGSVRGDQVVVVAPRPMR
jgi:cytoplasmic iron level regulating protein YaaA (DUF328/UPF0246 family)